MTQQEATPMSASSSVLPPDPIIGDLIGDGDTTPPDAPPDPLDPDAPSNDPPPESDPPNSDDVDTNPGIKVGPAKMTVEDVGKDGVTVGAEFKIPGS